MKVRFQHQNAEHLILCAFDSGMLCGTLTGKKKKKKMMYLTTKNAGVYYLQF